MIRAHMAWKVDIQIRLLSAMFILAIRSRISPAALLVKVMARICEGQACPVSIMWAMRWIMVRVFPDPAPASINSGPSMVSAASRCRGFNPSNKLMYSPKYLFHR